MHTYNKKSYVQVVSKTFIVLSRNISLAFAILASGGPLSASIKFKKIAWGFYGS